MTFQILFEGGYFIPNQKWSNNGLFTVASCSINCSMGPGTSDVKEQLMALLAGLWQPRLRWSPSAELL